MTQIQLEELQKRLEAIEEIVWAIVKDGCVMKCESCPLDAICPLTLTGTARRA